MLGLSIAELPAANVGSIVGQNCVIGRGFHFVVVQRRCTRGVATWEGEFECVKFKGCHTKGKNIDTVVRLLASHDLGSHVVRGAHAIAGLHKLGLCGQCVPKIDQLDLIQVFAADVVAGANVAVDIP